MITKIIIIALLVWGIWATTWDNMIFSKIPSYAARWKYFPKWFIKPLFECPICATPWYGTPIYWIVWGNSIEEYIVVIIATMGLSSIIVYLQPKG